MNKALKITLTIILFAVIFAAVIIGIKFAYDTYINSSYPLKYEEEVYSASDKYNIPKELIYGVIKTEPMNIILIAVISLLTAIFITLLLLRKLKVNENYVNVMPDNSYGSSENTHKIYLNDEYYTGYDNPQQNGDNIQNTQANNNQNDIHRF